MSPWPSSCSAPCSLRMVRLSILDATLKLMRVGKLALMVPVTMSTDGRCVAMMRWMPAARAILRQPLHGRSRSPCRRRSSGRRTRRRRRRCRASSRPGPSPAARRSASPVRSSKPVCTVRDRCSPRALRFAHARVEGFDVAHRERGHALVALLHLGDDPVERRHRLVRIGDDRRQQMRNAVVDRELQHLRIDHQEAALLRRSAGTASTGSSH